LRSARTLPTAPLDATDVKILQLYQEDTRRPAHWIGEQVNLSAAAVQRRLGRLRRAGVIVREAAQLSPAALGLHVTVIVQVDLERETTAHLQAFRALMRQCVEVQQCWYTAGPTDFVLVVRVATLAEYEAFTERVLLAHENVTQFTSHPVLGEVKSGLALPI
jgi:Lrp/AsnC family transcriptional regulator, leucine-responsive regulatory protein